jgi:endonuclease YncB( thermonuclease family)
MRTYLSSILMLARPLLLVLLLAASLARAELLHGKVVAIADGDTLTVLDAAKNQHKIRLSGIDAPEKRQPLGSRWKIFLAWRSTRK